MFSMLFEYELQWIIQVGRWPPRPVLQQPASNKVGLNSLGAGEQGTETLFYYSLPRRSRIINYAQPIMNYEL